MIIILRFRCHFILEITLLMQFYNYAQSNFSFGVALFSLFLMKDFGLSSFEF